MNPIDLKKLKMINSQFMNVQKMVIWSVWFIG